MLTQVLTDTFHKPGFKLHALILQKLFALAEGDGPVRPSPLTLSARKRTLRRAPRPYRLTLSALKRTLRRGLRPEP